MNEEWKDIPEYEGIYQASSHGRVRSLPRQLRDGRSRRGQYIAQCFKKSHGTFKVGLSRDSKRKTFWVHQLVLRAFVGEGEVAHHKDGDKANNHLDNLEWVDWGFVNQGKKGHRGFPNLLGQWD